MKKLLKAIGYFFAWLLGAIIIVAFSEVIWPDADTVPTGYALLVIFLPVVVLVLIAKKKHPSEEKGKPSAPVVASQTTTTQSTPQMKEPLVDMPFTTKKKQELADSIGSSFRSNLAYAEKEEDSVSLFLMWYQDAIEDLEKLAEFKAYPQIGLVVYDPLRTKRRLEEERQWHLCDAIVRCKDKALQNIKGKYRNSREFKVKEYYDFKRSVNVESDSFGDDARELAQKALNELALAAGVEIESTQETTQSFCDDLSFVDNMEGHAFEYWCADLLSKIGFHNVEVTKASNDQGIDVLAQKDGLKYAIQCKCYSSDLGNTPVQEASAGKMIYGCHVAAVMTNRHFTSGAKQLAEATNTLLWDRDELKRMLERAK